MRQNETLLLLSDPPRATFTNACEREIGRAEEISIPSRLGHPLKCLTFAEEIWDSYTPKLEAQIG